MKVYGIMNEDGSTDDGPRLLEDHFYRTKEAAESVRKKLYDKDLAERWIDFERDGYLYNKLKEEIQMGYFGNLNPSYEVVEVEVHDWYDGGEAHGKSDT